MNPIHQCLQKISPGNHFSYVRDRMYVRMYVRTDKGDAICPPPIMNGGCIKNNFLVSQSKYMLWVLKRTVSMRPFFCATNVKTDG